MKKLRPDQSIPSGATRREFIKLSGYAMAGTALASRFPAQASESGPPTVKAALIGCGGRGTGAARDCLEAAKVAGVNLQLTHMIDVFPDRLKRSRGALKDRGAEVPDSHCWLGFDAYKKVMETDVDLVLLATPPNFRPIHFAAATAAGKHVFMEKPVAVDPVGCRQIMESGRTSTRKNLAVVAGTQRRHEKGYQALAQGVQEGGIGKVLGGTIHFCLPGGSIGPKPSGKEDWEWMIRRWGGWCELSGDHIVEQHVHSIDVMNWFMGGPPVQCVTYGHRVRRTGGNMYDFFSTDYEYPGGVHIHSQCRQVTGCWSRIGQLFRGEKGLAEVTGLVTADRTFFGAADRSKKYPLPEIQGHKSPYVQEHVDLLRAIVEQKPLNEAQNVAEATLVAVMGRISAYTGQQVTWEEMMKSDFACRPSAADFEAGTVEMPKEEAPVPG